ncbi:MAG: hypothetical protein H6662_16560 [Ardenticatenaceae bacterium]|nr:hypothetical protein [Anaerolineales bacterium]MCB8923201.1 hypothetical protein [Ardenticatenaceae bacterium]MCB9004854.1 hypothetical protein [Ardenticatenaceae bacterium]
MTSKTHAVIVPQRPVHFFLSLLLVALAVQVAQLGSRQAISLTFPELPISLAPKLAQAVQADLPTAYQPQANGRHWTTTNPAQGWQTTFEATGPVLTADQWQWGLTLQSWGYAGAQQPAVPTQPTQENGRVTYQRGRYLSEWYLNTQWGLEQGFTLAQRPPAAVGLLTLQMNVTGSLTPQLVNAHTVHLLDAAGNAAAQYSGLQVFDSNGRILPAYLELENRTLRIRIDDSSASYPLTIDPWLQAAKLTVNGAADSDFFGFAVAVSGDTAVVGAPGCTPVSLESCFGSGNSAAYVFVKPASGWANATQTAQLSHSNAISQDFFGSTVAIDGDTIIVGSRWSTVGGNARQGAVYVYEKPLSGWADMSETVILTASDGIANDELGHSVAISGDTILAGADLADISGQSNQGAAYIFVRPGGGWAAASNETAKLTASDGAGNDRLGQSVGLDGDTAVVGAWLATVNGHTTQGAAYVFVKPMGGWVNATHTAKLTASDGDVNDQFGVSVAISGDTVAVGAFFNDLDNGSDGDTDDHHGAAYVFEKPLSGWADMTETALLTASDATRNDKLGRSIAISGDTVVVGAYQEEAPGFLNNAGVASIFVRPVTGWGNATEAAKLTTSDAGNSDYLGFAVAVDNGMIVSGAPGHNLTGTDEGAVYVFPTVSSAGSGDWDVTANWANNTIPGSGDDVVIIANATMTLTVDAVVRGLAIDRGATLVVPDGVTLTVTDAVINHGTMQQTQPVSGGSVAFLEIGDGGGSIVFRGADVSAVGDLGDVTVRVRTLNNGEYCTSAGDTSPTYIGRCYEITTTTPGTAQVRLWALADELNGLTTGILSVYRYEGSSPWTELLTSRSTGSNGDYVFAEGETPGFSHFLLGQSSVGPTAVSLQAVRVETAVAWPSILLLILLAGFTLVRVTKGRKLPA